MTVQYTELQVTSNFSFLRGASHASDLVLRALDVGLSGMAIADRNSFAGIVRGYAATRGKTIQYIVGARLDLQDGPSLLAYPKDKNAFSRLCQLITLGNLRTEKGKCQLTGEDVRDYREGIIFIIVTPEIIKAEFEKDIERYVKLFGRANLNLSASHYYRGDDERRLEIIAEWSAKYFVPMVATNDVHYHDPAQRELQDVMTCIREKCTIQNAGYKVFANAERHIKSPEEMARLFVKYPAAIQRTQTIAKACKFCLSELKYEYPEEITSDSRTPQEELVYQTWRGAAGRYGDVVPEKVIKAINYELKLIEELNYAPYFLTVFDIVNFAKSKSILCQGRGSAANSSVCYCLGITSVNPDNFDLLFERFISSARNEPPDIDVDFEHERREEVMQYVFAKYGRDRAAITGTVVRCLPKSALAEAGKVMGLSEDILKRFSKTIWGHDYKEISAERVKEQGFDITNPLIMKTFDLATQLLAHPRHLSQHVGGFVINKTALSDMCVTINATMPGRTMLEWDKDDIEVLGMMKVDVLSLGIMTCIRKCLDYVNDSHGQEYTLATIPAEDPVVYDMICAADTVGVFQIESRAQMNMLPRLRPREFYDLVIEVSIVRPGPIQGDMVHPYLKRRHGLERVTYPNDAMKRILSKTLGVPLFQEQAMQIAIHGAGFTPAEADQLRRAMGKFKLTGVVERFYKSMVEGMIANGYTPAYAARCFEQLQGFGAYGFPESHAASFASLVYASAWLKCHHPDAFLCAILNSQPMGFYNASDLIFDAEKHGVIVRPPDINHSEWDCTLESIGMKYKAVRLGFRQIKGLRETEIRKLVSNRGDGYASPAHLLHRAGITVSTMETLANADAFNSVQLDRRNALWVVKALENQPLNLFSGMELQEAPVNLKEMRRSTHVIEDYAAMSLSLKDHPVRFFRDRLTKKGYWPCLNLKEVQHGTRIRVCGMVGLRQRPMTAKGVMFVTIRDETDYANLVVFPNIYLKHRRQIFLAKMMMIDGTLERSGHVIHIIAHRVHDGSSWLDAMSETNTTQFPSSCVRADEIKHGPRGSQGRNRIFLEARNFD